MTEQKNKESAPVLSLVKGSPMSSRANIEKPKDMWKTIRRLIAYIGKSKGILLSLIVIMVAVTIIDIIGPYLQQRAIDTISFEDGKLIAEFGKMRIYLGIMVILFIVSAVMTYVQGVFAAKLSQSTVYSLRKELFNKISYLPIKYIDTHKHGDIMSRMTNDVENISNAVAQSITVLFSSVLTLIGAFSMMIYYSPLLTLIAIVTIPVIGWVSAKLAKFMRKYFKRQQNLLGELNGQVEEMVTGYRTVVAYGKEQDAIMVFKDTSDKLRKCSIQARVWGSIMGPIMNFLGNFQYVLLAATGGFLILRKMSGVTIGVIQAMLQYSKKFSHPINMVANQYSIILTALAGAERVFEILDQEKETDQGNTSIDVQSLEGNIEFRDVQFGYTEENQVLKGLNLSVRNGQKIAIVGSTGSGKTTIVNLLTRFYELDSGKILIDGVDIREIPKSQLRKLIAIVLQDTILFSDTINANLRYGNSEANDDMIRKAAAMAKADRFIERLPEGYDTKLTESGENISQGQRQLLSISRAILAYPKILIFDEATSSVDTRTEMQIQQAMLNLMKGRTSFIIAHRLSTIRDADLIVVLDDGKIAEKGSHENLLQKKGKYYYLYSKQFAGIVT